MTKTYSNYAYPLHTSKACLVSFLANFSAVYSMGYTYILANIFWHT